MIRDVMKMSAPKVEISFDEVQVRKATRKLYPWASTHPDIEPSVGCLCAIVSMG
jgi:hypothetical protein